ncbi:MAG: hypothetical protein R3A46_00365 [Thermomicrobiales bacterium]
MKRASPLAIALLILVGPLLLLTASRATAETPAASDFVASWTRYDLPVVEGIAERSWTFGPAPFSEVVEIPAAEHSSERRSAQYFDKGRIEEIDEIESEADAGAVRFSTLVSDLVAGRTLLGDGQYSDLDPIDIAVAGDADDPEAVDLRDDRRSGEQPPFNEGETLTTRVDGSRKRPGRSWPGPTSGSRPVFSSPETDHRIASVFWEFMTSSGTIWTDLQFETS